MLDPSHSAGTEEIAKGSGGDAMPISDASAFQDTLERLRQRYALHFYWPEGSSDPEQRTVVVNLAHSTGARYGGSEVRYRRAYLSNGRMHHAGGLIEVSREADPTDPVDKRSNTPVVSANRSSASTGVDDSTPPQTRPRHRMAVNESSGPVVNAIDVEPDAQSGGTPAAQDSKPANGSQPGPTPAKRGGWPRTDETKDHPD